MKRLLPALAFLISGLLLSAQPLADAVDEFRFEKGLTAVVVGVWEGDHPLLLRSFGDSQTSVPADLSMKFRAGGVCLTALTAVLLQSAEEGLLSLEDSIDLWFPDLPESGKITIRMLANCTTGYSDYVGNERFLDAFTENPFRFFTAGELIDYGMEGGRLFPPGEGWAYTHTTFVMLGEILADVHGKSVPELLRERIFQPLDLADTVYTPGPTLNEPVLHAYTTERGVFEESTFWNPSWTSYTGSIASTVGDVGKIARGIGRAEIISEESLEAMIAPTTVGLGPNTRERFYGMGIGVVGGWLLQNPNFGGYQGVMAFHPERDLTIVAFATHGKNSDPDAHHGMALFGLLEELLGGA